MGNNFHHNYHHPRCIPSPRHGHRRALIALSPIFLSEPESDLLTLSHGLASPTLTHFEVLDPNRVTKAEMTLSSRVLRVPKSKITESSRVPRKQEVEMTYE